MKIIIPGIDRLYIKFKITVMAKFIYFILLVTCTFFLGSCSVVEGIFKAGMWWAFILMFGFIALIVWFLSKRKK